MSTVDGGPYVGVWGTRSGAEIACVAEEQRGHEGTASAGRKWLSVDARGL
jgi:hypothetical protein